MAVSMGPASPSSVTISSDPCCSPQEGAEFASWSVTSTDSHASVLSSPLPCVTPSREAESEDDLSPSERLSIATDEYDRDRFLPPNWGKHQPLCRWAGVYKNSMDEDCETSELDSDSAESDSASESELNSKTTTKQSLKPYFKIADQANRRCPPWATNDEFIFTDQLAIFLNANRNTKESQRRCTSFFTSPKENTRNLRNNFLQFCRGTIDYQYMAEYFHSRSLALESTFTHKHSGISLADWMTRWKHITRPDICEELAIRFPSYESEPLARWFIKDWLQKENPGAAHDFHVILTARKHSAICFSRAQQMLLWLDIATFKSGFDWPHAYAALKDQSTRQTLSLSVAGLWEDKPAWFQTDIHTSVTRAASAKRPPVHKTKSHKKPKRLQKQHHA